MGAYDFDAVIPREGTDSLKHDAAMKRMGRNDLLPLWVADMDFRLPDEILADLRARVDHGVFGYAEPGERYAATLERWFQERYGYRIGPDWNTVTPGVVFAIACAVRACTEPGDAVLIQRPVYYPFAEMIRANGRRCVNAPLRREGGRYSMDLEDFERKIVSENVRLFILCSPHNPVGRVWTRAELSALAAVCERRGVTVLADEIHCDFIFPGHRFTAWLGLPEADADNAIVCTSPSKTFNLAGLQLANILIPGEGLRRRFRRECHACGYAHPNALGLAAAESAYRRGLPWLTELLAYLGGNVDFVRAFLADRAPGIRLIEPEGTYLLWLDCSGLGLDKAGLHDLIENRARLWLDHGDIFGEASALFERINIAAPRAVIARAMERLGAAAAALP